MGIKENSQTKLTDSAGTAKKYYYKTTRKVFFFSTEYCSKTMTSGGSSFQRKIKSKWADIPGVNPSIYTNQLLTSSGVPDLDDLIGGGLAVGSVILLEEDLSGNYSRLMLKYFLSEGLLHKHPLLVTNSSPDGKLITSSLPMFDSKDVAVDNQEAGSESETMKIAWRYQSQNTTKSSNLATAQRGRHTFNLLKTVPSELIENSDIQICDIESGVTADESWKNSSYHQLIKEIETKVQTGGFHIDPNVQQEHKNILRLGIQSLGASHWGEPSQTADRNLGRFLFCLRAILRSCFGVALITLPSHVLSLNKVRHKVLSLSDYFVSVQSFEGDEKVNVLYKDYHGLLDILKVQSLGSLAPPSQLIQDPGQLLFKSKRTKFLIEKFHLPPDLSENVARDNKDKTLKNIDF